MKTMRNGEEIKRVREIEVINMVKAGWKYIAKSEWKARKGDNKVEVAKDEVVNVVDNKQDVRQGKKSRKNWQKKVDRLDRA